MNRKLTAIAMAAIMLAGAMGFVSAVPADGEDPTLGYDMHYINMFVGDSFSYTPQTNLPSTIVALGSAMADVGGFLTFKNGTLSGTATESGFRTADLKATWESGDVGQEAMQIVAFMIYERISVTSPSYDSALYGQPFCYKLEFDGQGDEVVDTPSIINANGLKWNSSDNTITGTPEMPDVTLFSWTITSPSSKDSVQFTLTIETYSEFAITSPSFSETCVGGAYGHTVTTNVPATITVSGLPDSPGFWWNSPELMAFIDSSLGIDVSPYYKDHVITYTAEATINGALKQVQQSHTLRVWSSLSFTTTPSISNVSVAANGLSVLLTADITGAFSVLIDWGDGTTQTIDPNVTGTSVSEEHEYENAGMYNVRILASNDSGTTQSIVMLSASGPGADTGGGDNEDEDDDALAYAKSILEDYWYVIVILVLFILYLNAGRSERRNKGRR